MVANDCRGIEVSASDEADVVTVNSNSIYVWDLLIELLGGNDWVNFSYNSLRSSYASITVDGGAGRETGFGLGYWPWDDVNVIRF